MAGRPLLRMKPFCKRIQTVQGNIRNFIWFTAIWAEGFAELEKRDASRTTEYREVFEEMLTHGIQNCERFDGLIPHDCARDWRPDEDVYDRLLLTHCANAEMAFLLS